MDTNDNSISKYQQSVYALGKLFWDMNSANDALWFLANGIIQGIKDTKPTSDEYRTHKLSMISWLGQENEIKIYKE